MWVVINEDRFEKYNILIFKNPFLLYATRFMIIYVFREISKIFMPAPGDVTSFLKWIVELIICVILTYLFCALFDLFMKKAKLEKMENVLTGNQT